MAAEAAVSGIWLKAHELYGKSRSILKLCQLSNNRAYLILSAEMFADLICTFCCCDFVLSSASMIFFSFLGGSRYFRLDLWILLNRIVSALVSLLDSGSADVVPVSCSSEHERSADLSWWRHMWGQKHMLQEHRGWIRLLPATTGEFTQVVFKWTGRLTEEKNRINSVINHRKHCLVTTLQAECCSDHRHCCYQGTLCDLEHGRCVNKTVSLPWMRRLPAVPQVLQPYWTFVLKKKKSVNSL